MSAHATHPGHESDVGPEHPGPEARMSLVGHLTELKVRITRSILALLIGFVVAYSFHLEIFAFLTAPVREALADRGIYRLLSTEIMETLFAYLKASLVASIVVTGPFSIYQLWLFVAPGLLPEERKFVAPIAAFSGLFFLLGAAFAYYVLLPFVTGFMVDLALADGQVELKIKVSHAFSFTFSSLAVFGIIFEIPIAMFFLSLFGLADHRAFIRFFRFFIVIAFIVGAVLTPPEPASQVMLAVPMVALYGLGILIAWLIHRRPLDESGKRRAIGWQIWGTVSGALLVVAAAIGGIVWLLMPVPPTAELVPAAASWASGYNVANMPLPYASQAAARFVLPDMDREAPAFGALSEALQNSEIAEVIAFELATGPEHRGLLVEAQPAAGEALGEAAHAAGLTSQKLTSESWVLGSSAAVQAADECAGDADECARLDRAWRNRIDALRTRGPAWALMRDEAAQLAAREVPTASELPAVTSVEAVLETEPELTLVWRVQAPSEAEAGALRARISTWRELHAESARAAGRDEAAARQLTALVRASRELAAASRAALQSQPSESARESADSKLRRERALAALERAEGQLSDAFPDVPSQSESEDGTATGEQPWLLDRLARSAVLAWSTNQDGAYAELRFRIEPIALQSWLVR